MSELLQCYIWCGSVLSWLSNSSRPLMSKSNDEIEVFGTNFSLHLTGRRSQGWLSRKNFSSMLGDTSLGIVVALTPGRAIKTSQGFRLASAPATLVAGTGAGTATVASPCSAAWPLIAGLLVSY